MQAHYYNRSTVQSTSTLYLDCLGFGESNELALEDGPRAPLPICWRYGGDINRDGNADITAVDCADPLGKLFSSLLGIPGFMMVAK